MKSILLLLLIIVIIINGNEIDETNMNNNKLYIPKEIHLALTDKSDEMLVTWITKGSINSQPLVYLFKGDCAIVTPSTHSNSHNNHNNNNQLQQPFNISIGKSSVYNGLIGYVHSVTLNNLEPGKSYCYSVGSGSLYRHGIDTIEQPTNTNKDNNNNNKAEDQENDDLNDPNRWSKWIPFKTKSNEIDHITFGAFADSGTWGDVHDVVAAMTRDESLTLAIHGGDLSYGLKEEVWDTFGNIIEPLASKMPFMVIPGNWDVKDGALLPFVNRYPMPLAFKQPTVELKRITTGVDGKMTLQSNPNLYYSFQYTHVSFIMLSSYDPYQLGSQQYNWLVSELEKANQMRDQYPWIIVVAHSPMYSSSTGHGGSDKTVRTQLEWLFSLYNVNLVFSGHDHGYERTHPVLNEKVLKKNHNAQYKSEDGTIHILGGTGGATADPWFEEQPNWSAVRESTSGYTKFIAHKQTLQVTYLRMNGTMGDHFQITNQYPDHKKFTTPIKPNSSIRSSEHTGVFLLFFALIIFVFPICAYFKLPNLIFSSLVPKPLASNKSMV